MTVPNERRNAVNWTREFLIALINPKATPRVPLEIRRRARSLLRHFPHPYEMDQTAQRYPETWGTWDGKRPSKKKSKP